MFQFIFNIFFSNFLIIKIQPYPLHSDISQVKSGIAQFAWDLPSKVQYCPIHSLISKVKAALKIPVKIRGYPL